MGFCWADYQMMGDGNYLLLSFMSIKHWRVFSFRFILATNPLVIWVGLNIIIVLKFIVFGKNVEFDDSIEVSHGYYLIIMVWATFML